MVSHISLLSSGDIIFVLTETEQACCALSWRCLAVMTSSVAAGRQEAVRACYAECMHAVRCSGSCIGSWHFDMRLLAVTCSNCLACAILQRPSSSLAVTAVTLLSVCHTPCPACSAPLMNVLTLECPCNSNSKTQYNMYDSIKACLLVSIL